MRWWQSQRISQRGGFDLGWCKRRQRRSYHWEIRLELVVGCLRKWRTRWWSRKGILGEFGLWSRGGCSCSGLCSTIETIIWWSTSLGSSRTPQTQLGTSCCCRCLHLQLALKLSSFQGSFHSKRLHYKGSFFLFSLKAVSVFSFRFAQ